MEAMMMKLDDEVRTTMTSPPVGKGLISRPAAGRILGVGPKGIDGLISRGELNAWRVGTRIKLDEAEVKAYLRRARIKP